MPRGYRRYRLYNKVVSKEIKLTVIHIIIRFTFRFTRSLLFLWCLFLASAIFIIGRVVLVYIHLMIIIVVVGGGICENGKSTNGIENVDTTGAELFPAATIGTGICRKV